MALGGKGWTYPTLALERNMVSPYLSRHRESNSRGKLIEVWVQEGGESESSSVMGEIGVERSCNITLRESAQTSTRSPLTREQGKPIKEAKQMTVHPTGAASHDIVEEWHEHPLESRSPQRASAPGTYRGAPVRGHQFQRSLGLHPLWEWGLLSALPQRRKTASGPEHGIRRENEGSSKSAGFPEQS
jgi:hypothetical protein